MSLADRLKPAGSKPRQSPNIGAEGGRTRDGPSNNSTRPSSRNAPYTKTITPTPSTSTSTSNGARNSGVEGQWTHDLFDPLSDLYRPQLNTQVGKAARSNSAGSTVFGKALNGISNASSNTGRGARSPLASPLATHEQGNIFGRFGLDNGRAGPASQGSTSAGRSAADERREHQRKVALAEAHAREQEELRRLNRKKDQETQARELEEQRQRDELLRQEALDNQMARQQQELLQQQRLAQPQTTLVLIENLVDGTTPEDVKAALADFGQVEACKVVASNGDTVSMQLDFTRRVDAQKAVQQLNGALADGKTLKLSIQERAPVPVQKSSGMTLKGSHARQDVPRQSSVSRPGPDSEQRRVTQAPAPVDEPMQAVSRPGPPSRLRSDQLAAYDEHASFQDRPQQQRMQQQAARSGKPQNVEQQKPAPSLAQRFGVQPQPNVRQQDNSGRGSGRNQNQSRANNGGPGTLFSRLGNASRRDDSAMDTS